MGVGAIKKKKTENRKIEYKWNRSLLFFRILLNINYTYLPVPPIIVDGKGGGSEGSAIDLAEKSVSTPTCCPTLKTNEVPE